MITKPRKLRSHDSVWLHERAPRVAESRLTRDVRGDALVIGAGITGAMVSQAIAEAGFDVIVADRRAPMQGATTASTALVQYEIDTPLLELREKIGVAKAGRAWRRTRLAVDGLRSTFARLGIAARERDALYLSGNRLSPAQLREECRLRRALGLDTIFLNARELDERFGIARPAALMGFDNLAINPRRATAQLLKDAIRNGARLYAPVEITDIRSERSGVVAQTNQGPSIRVRWTVLATGYEFPMLLPLKGHKITTTWAFATKPQPRKLWPGECLIWEAANPYLYMRTTDDGRVICGGEDSERMERPDEDSVMERKLSRLRAKLGKLFPELDTGADFSWAASFGETATGLPIIAPLPRHRNCWAALGYGGNGITYSRIAAEIIRAALTGGRDADADLYGFR
jgi:glycine/D-amino acid oxidase-like deaminating enzyme